MEVHVQLDEDDTIIAEIFVYVKSSHANVSEFLYATELHTARAVSHTLVYVHRFRMRKHFVLSVKSMKYTKLNCVRKLLRLQ